MTSDGNAQVPTPAAVPEKKPAPVATNQAATANSALNPASTELQAMNILLNVTSVDGACQVQWPGGPVPVTSPLRPAGFPRMCWGGRAARCVTASKPHAAAAALTSVDTWMNV